MSTPGPSLCIIAQNAYGALCGGYHGHVGGAEHQTSLMARWLAARGFGVSLVTWDEGQQDGETIDGVRVVKLCRFKDGLPGLRFFHPRLTHLLSALRRADADIYYQNSAEYVTGLAAWWCRRQGRKFVYSAAAELACDPRLPLIEKRYERALYRYGVRQAHQRIVQTRRQQRLLKDGWGLDAAQLPMPCPGPAPQEYREPTLPQPTRVGWVGRLFEGKRLEWLLDIATWMPDVQFDVAASGENGSAYAHGLRARAASLSNVNWLGSVPRERMPHVYQQMTCLCCTSAHEGFPNTFIEAWSHGRPVVSSFDPDGLIASLQLGVVARQVPDFVEAIRSLEKSPETWRTASRNARAYYLKHHPLDIAMAGFERVFQQLGHNASSTLS